MRSAIPSWTRTLPRVAVSVGLFAWVLRRAELSVILGALFGADPLWLALAAAAFGSTLFVVARWKALLGAGGADLRAGISSSPAWWRGCSGSSCPRRSGGVVCVLRRGRVGCAPLRGRGPMRRPGRWAARGSRPGGRGRRTPAGAASIAALATSIVGATACDPAAPTRGLPGWAEGAEAPPPARGLFRVVAFVGPDDPGAGEPIVRRATFVRDSAFRGMEDNDLRGMLDGTFKWGWNQPGQVHVRIGRRQGGAAFGEYELFRVLHRWELGLPEDVDVRAASLRLAVEIAPPWPVDLFLYEVKSDWTPGEGGVRGDNVSPPRPGEVWWNDRAFERAPWGLPGAGFASDSPGADTGATPLAVATVEPADSTIVLESLALTAYAARRVREGRPLLFLLKLSDHDEDRPGASLALYSASEGDERAVSRRPALALEWERPGGRVLLERPVLVEYGRSLVFPAVQTAGAEAVSVEFLPDEGSGPATVQARAPRAGAGSGGVWSPVGRVAERAGPALVTRLVAAQKPVRLGEPFGTRFRNTWVRTAAPEAQRVPVRFVAPSGRRHEVDAEYAGDYEWTIEFEPDEIGPWRYAWSHGFTEDPYESATGRFDVLGGDLENVIERLVALARRAEGGMREDPDSLEWLRVQLMKLERAGVQRLDPQAFRGPPGERLREALRSVRAALGEPRPDTIPLRPSWPAEWQREEDGTDSP